MMNKSNVVSRVCTRCSRCGQPACQLDINQSPACDECLSVKRADCDVTLADLGSSPSFVDRNLNGKQPDGQ